MSNQRVSILLRKFHCAILRGASVGPVLTISRSHKCDYRDNNGNDGKANSCKGVNSDNNDNDTCFS